MYKEIRTKQKVIGEFGYEQAMLGISLSYNSTPERASQIAVSLAHRGGGHSKFLEQIELWIDITTKRNIWQELDTYRHVSKSSESTMHTLTKNEIVQEDFATNIPEDYLSYLNEIVSFYKGETNPQEKIILLTTLKDSLPEGFLQRRMVHMNYATLQNIYRQRINHKLEWWRIFLFSVLEQIEHPEFILPIDK